MALGAGQKNSRASPQGHSTGPAALAELYILLSLATLLVALRCYGHIRFTKDWGWDISSIIVALVISRLVACSRYLLNWDQIFLVIGAILLKIEVPHSLRTHLADLPDPKGSISALL